MMRSLIVKIQGSALFYRVKMYISPLEGADWQRRVLDWDAA
jgi:hypothetical protein